MSALTIPNVLIHVWTLGVESVGRELPEFEQSMQRLHATREAAVEVPQVPSKTLWMGLAATTRCAILTKFLGPPHIDGILARAANSNMSVPPFQVKYLYSYNQSGRVTAQRMKVYPDPGAAGPVTIDANYEWDNEGRMTSLTGPGRLRQSAGGNVQLRRDGAAQRGRRDVRTGRRVADLQRRDPLVQ